MASHVVAQGEADGAAAEDPAEVTKRIAAALPSSKEAVFAAPIDWVMFDAARETLMPRLSGWVDKKIQDMLGEREESMVGGFTIELVVDLGSVLSRPIAGWSTCLVAPLLGCESRRMVTLLDQMATL